MAFAEAEKIIETLGLKPHPEGGFFTETYRHARSSGDRSLSTAIYYLVTAESPSRMHRVSSDEIWHFYAGDTLEMLLLSAASSRVIAIGPDVLAGERPQVLVPANAWQGVRVKPGGKYGLVGATVSPGFDYADFEIGTRAALVADYPHYAEFIEFLTTDS